MGLSTIFNAAPARPFTSDLPDLVDILVVNAIEAEMMGRRPCVFAGNGRAYLQRRGSQQDSKSVIVTAGGDGVAYFDRSARSVILAGINVVVESTHGAGDAFVGTLAARLAVGDPIDIALSIANREAAKLVSTSEGQREV